MKNKKAQGMSLNMIVLAAIAVTILIVIFVMIRSSVDKLGASGQCGSSVNKGFCLENSDLNTCGFGYTQTPTDSCTSCCVQSGIKSPQCNSAYPICRKDSDGKKIDNNPKDPNGGDCFAFGEKGSCFMY